MKIPAACSNKGNKIPLTYNTVVTFLTILTSDFRDSSVSLFRQLLRRLQLAGTPDENQYSADITLSGTLQGFTFHSLQ